MTANTIGSGNKWVGGDTIHAYGPANGATTPWPTLSDTNTYTGGGGNLYADLAAYMTAVPGAIDCTRTYKRYLLEVLSEFFSSVPSKEGAQEAAAFMKANFRKNPAGGAAGFDDRFFGRKPRNWVIQGAGGAAV